MTSASFTNSVAAIVIDYKYLRLLMIAREK